MPSIFTNQKVISTIQLTGLVTNLTARLANQAAWLTETNVMSGLKFCQNPFIALYDS